MTNFFRTGSLIAFLIGLLLCHGCSASYSPPARSAHYGSPGRFKQGQLEVTGAIVDGIGSVDLYYAPLDWLQVEAGVDGMTPTYTMGFTGLRFSPWPIAKQKNNIRLLSDLELGIGFGAGGEKHGEVHYEPAVGGYTGAGLGIGIHWFDLFGRVRVQGSQAMGNEPTLWLTTLAGAQFNIVELVKIYGGAGYGFYWNELDSGEGLVWEFGLGFTFDLYGGRYKRLEEDE